MDSKSWLMVNADKPDVRDDSCLQIPRFTITQPHSNNQATPHTAIGHHNVAQPLFSGPQPSCATLPASVSWEYMSAISNFLSISPSDTMAEWSKAVDLSPAWISTTEMCVGSNPTRVILLNLCSFCCHLFHLFAFCIPPIHDRQDTVASRCHSNTTNYLFSTSYLSCWSLFTSFYLLALLFVVP
jgi:hypothetical protein